MLYGKATEIDGLVDRLCTWVALPALPGDYLYDTAGVQYSWDSRYDWSYWDDEAPSA